MTLRDSPDSPDSSIKATPSSDSQAADRPNETVKRRKRWPWIVLTLALLLAFDLSRAPNKQISAAVLLAGINGYQSLLSPAISSAGVSCRFQPTCSRYAEGVIEKYGALGGSRRALWRILRCGPWAEPGTVDPP